LGRPPGSKNKPKNTNGAEAPVEASGTNGHNQSGGVSEAAYFECKREIESLERQKDEVVGRLREARKHWKDKGIDLKVFDLTRKLRKYTQPELADQLNKTIAYAKFEKLPVYSQLDIFEQIEVSEEDRLKEARQMGLVAGKSGTDVTKCPWPEETPMGREWLNGHFDGVQDAKTQSQVGAEYVEA
jgi:ribosome modulation factor/uncharacterized protein (UPF0335 family)